ncbi:BrnT family toxin [Candidatus Chloroploca sp. Khr17]|uniref:BrnT family toxin n=1 Tax=Candidatus Chloroploca sp. Khr17 TaxID=2496869 RepID=UPI00101D2E5E|nr:BrnT family toxin [Candidatus Chloroploca sp. Khr17]
MDVVFWLQGMTFEWNDEKAKQNLVRHGIAFPEAAEVFFDPFYQSGDATPDGVSEQRDFILGYSISQRLLLVVFTERGERTKIISARTATRAERKQYESA